MPPALPEHLDALVVGARLSGIGAAVRLQTQLPGTKATGTDQVTPEWTEQDLPDVPSLGLRSGLRFSSRTEARAG